MKVKISCPKCRSNNVSIVPNAEGTTPMYKCVQCGYKNNLFPQFGKKSEEEKED
jgi:Zn ribbon nucleic-acid-binding protein